MSLPIIEYSGKGQTSLYGFSTNKTKIGSGNTGTVYESGISSDVVIKKSTRKGKYSINKDKDYLSYLNEYKMGFTLEHKCLRKVYAFAIKTREDGKKVYRLKMERINGKSLSSQALEKLSMQQLKKNLTDTLDCANYLDSRKITWSDLTPSNTFITESSEIKFIDPEYYKEVLLDYQRSMDLVNEYSAFCKTLKNACVETDHVAFDNFIKEINLICWQDLPLPPFSIISDAIKSAIAKL